MSHFRSDDAVDLSVVITFSGQHILDVGNLYGSGLIRRTVAVPAIVGGIVVALVVGRIVTVLIVVRIAVRARIISIPGWITVTVVRVAVRIVIVSVGIVKRPAEPWEESDIEDEPGTVHETATVPIPKMVAIAVPIAMPTDRLLREDVIVSGANVANDPISAASSELRSPIATLPLHLCEPVGLDRSVILEARETIAGDSAVQAAV